MDKIVALIPARGGSKGIPEKNLRLLNGRTLVEWSIIHALESELIERVFVSTDSQKIRDVALKAGAEVPFLRPDALSGDQVLDFPVFIHLKDWLEYHENSKPEIFVQLRPTTPFRKAGWIDEAVKLLRDNDQADSVRSVSKVVQHPYRMFEIASSGFLNPIMSHKDPNPSLLRRQDLPPTYFYNCVIDVTRRRTLIDQSSMTGKKMLPWIMPSELAIDIDTPYDLDYADWFMKRNKVF